MYKEEKLLPPLSGKVYKKVIGMQTYSDVVNRLGNQAFHNYMGGSMQSSLWGMNLDTIAWIYGVREEELRDAVLRKEASLKKEHYEKSKKYTWRS